MIRCFKPHTSILPPAQQLLWPELAPAPRLGLVLYGGTAIALRLGHRYSVDFDFFTDRPLDKDAIGSSFSFTAGSLVIQESRDTLSLLVSSGPTSRGHVKVSFFGAVGMGRVGEPELTEDGILQVASLEDLMATKVKVILQRIEAKDYRDVAAMLEAGVNLAAGLAAARAMYGRSFQPSESLKAMVYFEGGDLHTLSPGEKEILIQAAAAIRDLPPVALTSHELALPAE
ncbi:MAG: nucleotidyl transferase AbiEii/AbiGii toxin family protein [Syntrophobacteraceae bacterium]|nr:nucleotidyl transferase AbiEii/AbiGii toxin family protein [Syntrophobacteraceae bacterium]